MNPSLARLLFALLAAASLAAGCSSPSARLTFPAPMEGTTGRTYDISGDGAADFAVLGGGPGRPPTLAYNDDADGAWDRLYNLAEFDEGPLPHLIVMVDSVPYQEVRDRWEGAGWWWFDEPRPVIAPIPTMSGVIFSRITGAPPLDAPVNRHYNARAGRKRDMLWERVFGHENPWQQRTHYRAKYWENGLAFLEPRQWYGAELARAKRTFDESPDPVTIVYIASAAAMLSKHGKEGLDEVLDGLEQLSLQLLYERQGAVRISMLSDHGHSLVPVERIDLEPALEAAGFTPSRRIGSDADVVIDHDGLVNYTGLHTRRPAAVADALLTVPAVNLLCYLEVDRVIVRTPDGRCAIERQEGRGLLRMELIEGDPLGYRPVIDAMQAEGLMTTDGFASPDAWFEATWRHEWPDMPARLWNAFHGAIVHTPTIMLTVRDGFCVGPKSLEKYIDMQSTHGGFDQRHSAAFLVTGAGRAPRPAYRSHEVLPAIEPRYNSMVRQR
jgi:hypothetical protein